MKRVTTLVLAVLATCSHAAATDPSLNGCWRAVKIARYVDGSANMEDRSGRCALRFDGDVLASTCATSGGTMTTTYRYRIDRPNFYLATMVGSTFRTDAIGSTREYEFHVDGDRLVTSTSLPSAAPGSSPVTVRIETEAERMPCP